MPHLTLEFSQGVNPTPEEAQALLQELNTVLFASGHFKSMSDIKSRIYHADASMVGAGEGEEFVAARLALMPGRDEAIKEMLAKSILGVLEKYFAKCTPIQLTVDVVDLSSAYQKQVLR